jgi:predicted 3-demethylubiquinone-9 3-methyltransferase (glyoxalase superfamily)
MARSAKPFLMFEGKGQEAMSFYVSLFPDGQKLDDRTFSIAGQKVMFFDSPVPHGFTFTPSFSFFIECESEAELRRLAAALGENGKVMMEIANHGFSTLFTWVSDRFGVSWQLNLASP